MRKNQRNRFDVVANGNEVQFGANTFARATSGLGNIKKAPDAAVANPTADAVNAANRSS